MKTIEQWLVENPEVEILSDGGKSDGCIHRVTAGRVLSFVRRKLEEDEAERNKLAVLAKEEVTGLKFMGAPIPELYKDIAMDAFVSGYRACKKEIQG